MPGQALVAALGQFRQAVERLAREVVAEALGTPGRALDELDQDADALLGLEQELQARVRQAVQRAEAAGVTTALVEQAEGQGLAALRALRDARLRVVKVHADRMNSQKAPGPVFDDADAALRYLRDQAAE